MTICRVVAYIKIISHWMEKHNQNTGRDARRGQPYIMFYTPHLKSSMEPLRGVWRL